MNLLRDKRGASKIEVFCIVGICLIIAFLLFLGVRYYLGQMEKGNDSLRENTAESTARMNISTSGCVVNGCDGEDKTCTHREGEETTGYFDPVEKKILGEKIKGYNEHPIDDKEKNTLIIRVTADQSGIVIDWIEGDNR